jgi:hypothetical protein
MIFTIAISFYLKPHKYIHIFVIVGLAPCYRLPFLQFVNHIPI